MASVETNDRKREEMASHIIRLRNLGWTKIQLAVWMDVTPGTVAHWNHAESMGNNFQRAELAKLGSPAEERPRILGVADSLEKEANLSERVLTADIAAEAHHVAEYRAARIARIRARVKALRALFD